MIKNPARRSKADKDNIIAYHSSPRIYILAFFILTAALVIFAKLYYLQVVAHASYKALADDQHFIFQHLVPKRGEIYLKDKNDVYPVAVNKEVKMAYAVPKEVEDPGRTAEAVSSMLGLEKSDILPDLEDSKKMYKVLKHRLTDEEADRIKNAKIKGLYLSDESFRYYPAGELAAQVLGFVGWRDNHFGGRYGLELHLDEKLRGKEGTIFNKADNSGRWITLGEKVVDYAQDGDSFVLTIDRIVQYQTEKILASAVEKFEAERGTIIVMEANTGKIMALANYPTYDPNNYAEADTMEVYRNLAVSDAYESGSVFKTITLASALDAEKITPETTYVDTGTVVEAGYAIKNSDFKAYGKQTMTNVLENSLNTGVIFAQKLVGNKNFADYIRRFGFGESTGVELYGESAGNIKNLNNLKSDIQFFTASFGQGITMTPMQLIAAYNAIANGGTLMKPQIIEKVIHPDNTVTEIEPEEVRRVISQKAAIQAGKMLESVVKNGHGKRAAVPGYLVGGKTGTAQVASMTAKGYEEGKSIGSFAGFAPVDDPKYTILVRMDDPKSVEWAESSAAPTFGELMKFLLEYGNIEPTEKYTPKEMDEFNATHTLNQMFIRKDEEEKDKNEDKKDKEK